MAILKYRDSAGNLHGVNSYKINPVIVAQGKGTSETEVMSQKAVSDEVEVLETAVATKANAADVYDKNAIDSKVSTLNTNIGKKANSSDVYTKGEVDAVVTAANNAINSKVPIDSFNQWSEGVAMKEDVNGQVDEVNQKAEANATAITAIQTAASQASQALANEVSRATAKEGELSTAIGTKAANADLTAEVNRAKAAEKANADAIAELMAIDTIACEPY